MLLRVGARGRDGDPKRMTYRISGSVPCTFYFFNVRRFVTTVEVRVSQILFLARPPPSELWLIRERDTNVRDRGWHACSGTYFDLYWCEDLQVIRRYFII